MAKADPQRPFVHLDVQTAYSTRGTSPSLAEDYVRALARQHPLDARASDAEPIYLAIADYGLTRPSRPRWRARERASSTSRVCECAWFQNAGTAHSPSSP